MEPQSMDHRRILSKKEDIKLQHLKQLSTYRKELERKPRLRQLFFEMTIQCNEHCRHCGSQCGDFKEENPLSKEEITSLMKEVAEQFDTEGFMFCITGGEPLLRNDLFEIMETANSLHIPWGMTSNATLMTKEMALKCKETGMRSISVSVDGLKQSHEWFRRSLGSYEKTIQGIKNLVEVGIDHVQITTVIHAKNIHELSDMYQEFQKLGIRSWRVINIEPIGRAKEQEDLLLSKEQYKELFDFIREHRFQEKMSVEYGCSHFLGLEYEREVRPWYFLCNAGVYTASICYNGDVTSCLDVERREEYIEGNVRTQSFKDIWENGFTKYRSDFRKVGKCASCQEYKFCHGDSFHSWNLDEMRPNVCFKDVLF